MEAFTVTVQEAQRLSGIGKTKLFELIRDQRLETVQLGRRRFVKVASLKRLLGADEGTA